jgi:hypothetical protein
MGMLLRFSARTPRSVPATPDTGQEEEKVLLFTGVRYERDPANLQTKPARRKPRIHKGRSER